MPHVDIKLTIQGENLSLVHEVIKRLWGEEFCSDYYDSIRATETQLTFENEIESMRYLQCYFILDLTYVLKKLFPDLSINENILESFSESVLERVTTTDNNYFIETYDDENTKIKVFVDLDGNPITNLQVFLRKKKIQKLNNVKTTPKKYSEEVIFKFIEKYLKVISIKRDFIESEEKYETEIKSNNLSDALILKLKMSDLDKKYSEIKADCNEILSKG